MIFTSYWAARLPSTMLRIGISRSVPRGFPGGYKLLKSLNPGTWFNSVDDQTYWTRYQEILDALDAEKLVAHIRQMADGRDCALVCWESGKKPEEFCHRAQVSLWLWNKLRIEVPEHDGPRDGFGPRHPLLPRFLRNATGLLL